MFLDGYAITDDDREFNEQVERVINHYLDTEFHKNETGAKWISVKDAYPEKARSYLTIDNKGYIQICFYLTSDPEKNINRGRGFYVFYREVGFLKCFSVTHWMELPEPPTA